MSCDEYVTEVKLYNGRDNAVTIIPYSDLPELTNYDMTNVTRVTGSADLTTSTSTGDAIVGDSAVDSSLVAWDNLTGEWRIHIKVGMFVGMAPGEYYLVVTLYDPDHPNGWVLPETDSTLKITVIDIP